MRQGTPFDSLTEDERAAVLFERQLELNARLEACVASRETEPNRATRVIRARRAVDQARRAVDCAHEGTPAGARDPR
jgi:hypothetical protein